MTSKYVVIPAKNILKLEKENGWSTITAEVREIHVTSLDLEKLSSSVKPVRGDSIAGEVLSAD